MSRTIKTEKSENKVGLGKYILDSLSIGMYTHPLMALREYIQNSADSIDSLVNESLTDDPPLIDIRVDGRDKSLSILDNGIGISSQKAKRVLHDLGCSEKDRTKNRGFRGIGRLGGLGYCDELVFYTKYRNEDTVSTSVWDCKKLRQLLGDLNVLMDINSLIDSISRFHQEKYSGSKCDHFFKVELNNINDNRTDLLNVPSIKSYLSQVAPVPFNPTAFHHAQTIEKELIKIVPTYRTYNIFVNGQQIYKPYSDNVNLSKGSSETIKQIKPIKLTGESGILGFGWMAELELRGTISSVNEIEGIRLRSGNILIGNKDSLSGFFREKRFNSYLVGEIYANDDRLIPNSRRDDFEDNEYKAEFYDLFIKEVGIPISRTIRMLSQDRGAKKKTDDLDVIFNNAKRIIEYGYLSELQRDQVLKKLSEINGSHKEEDKNLALEFARRISDSKPILEQKSNIIQFRAMDLINNTVNSIYSRISDRAQVDRLTEDLYTLLIRGPVK